MPNTLIRNGTVVTADETRAADVLIEGERIKEVRAGIPQDSASTVIDAAGMYVMPGGIDAHTHLDMPFGGTTSADDFETGTRAAAFGGTTCIVDFAIQARGTRMRAALDTWWKKAEGRACIDYGLHMIVTDLGACGLEDMDDMVNEGVASFKLFMAYPNVLMVRIEHESAAWREDLAAAQDFLPHLFGRTERQGLLRIHASAPEDQAGA